MPRVRGGAAESAFLAIQRAADHLSQALAAVLKPHGLSATQYNVLRILRGSPAGLACSQIAGRLLTHDPDVTRLADRLAGSGLVCRDKDAADRRLIVIRLTPAGLALLAELDPVIADFHKSSLGHMKRAELDSVAALLERVRAAP